MTNWADPPRAKVGGSLQVREDQEQLDEEVRLSTSPNHTVSQTGRRRFGEYVKEPEGNQHWNRGPIPILRTIQMVELTNLK